MDKEKALKIWLPVIADGVKNLPECKESLEMAIKALENQKTGHWKKISPAGIMECSVCGGNVLTSDIEAYKYCHHCGAKMEERANEICN